ncbi:MAG TPA: diaminopimelate epimerase [Paludibacteraceae bacterium]|nr:diaminopimelate epimerase [Paludibacteraceae bacterium]HOU68660.1 diaminopimelate epimerase [Paludibacteraceae bacterium]HPH62217.1 diaminopimelate epimerase [Paludibacteraceae bacterium]HQF50454.1 diaminopimelate epimerase [Paludibacteraceae bacterium]
MQLRKIKFTKMQGISNDYIYINCFEESVENPSDLAIKMSNRHTGVGSDGLVLIMPSESCDFRMRMFNSDGSEAEMCGNASRCVGKFLYDKGLTKKKLISLETLAGRKMLELHTVNERVDTVTVDMGEPIFEASLILTTLNSSSVMKFPLQVNSQTYSANCLSMGNPHCVLFMDEIDDLNLEKIGPLFESHPIFPKKTNTEFIKVLSEHSLRMRVWERGAGETMACGTGACASVVTAVLNGYCDGKVIVSLRGGDLEIEWNRHDKHVYMTGAAVTVFEGTYEL